MFGMYFWRYDSFNEGEKVSGECVLSNEKNGLNIYKYHFSFFYQGQRYSGYFCL